jgi:hypothetical protein
MILRLSDSVARGVVVAAAIVTAAWLSFFGIRTAVAQYGAEGNDARRLQLAVRLEPRNPAYWYSLGRFRQYNLEQPDPTEAEADYQRAITLNPLATDAWLDLGTAYELDGKNPEARQAFIQAKRSVSWRYGNFLLRQGDRTQAYTEMRRAMEADPQRAAAAFSRAYRSNPDIDEIISQLLPAEQSVYVDVVNEAAAEGQMAVAQKVWNQLQSINPRLTFYDFDRFVSELMNDHEFAKARQVWEQGTATMNLPKLFQQQGTVIWDPSFESGVNGRTFSWNYSLKVVQGVSISLDRTMKLSGLQSLRMSFDGKHNPDMGIACTGAVVEPGTTYHFSGWIKTKDITTLNGIRFGVTGDEGGIPAMKTNEIHGTIPWSEVEDNWTAGANTHRAVVCVSRDASDNPEVRISGTAWVDDVNLVPQPAAPKPAEHKFAHSSSTGPRKP